VFDISINVLIQTSALVGQLYKVPFIFNAYKIVYVIYVKGSSFLRPSSRDLKVAWHAAAEINLFLFVCGHACSLHAAESFLRN
jgi:hypothetical protein